MKKRTKIILISALLAIAAFMYRNEISALIPLIHRNNAPKPEETNPKSYEYYYSDYKDDAGTNATWPAYN